MYCLVHCSLCAAPVLNVGTPDVFTSASQPTTLICEASGTPAPTVSWTRNEEPLDKERFIQLADGSLFINDTDLQDEGTYTVAASNSVGEEASRVKLIVTKPTPPDSKRKINLIQHFAWRKHTHTQAILFVHFQYSGEKLKNETINKQMKFSFALKWPLVCSVCHYGGP